MSCRRRIIKLLIPVLALAGCLTCARAQDVVIYLRNGDRVAGKIISEDTNQVVVSTVWIKELAIPVSQIERRETLPPGTLPTAAKPGPTVTNAPPGPTNLVTVIKTPKTTVVVSNAIPVTTNWFKRHFKGEVNVGSALIRGATDSELYYGKASLTYSQPYASDPKQFFRNIFTYYADYGRTDGTLSANDMGGSSKTDFDVNRRVYVYNLGAASYDEIRKIDLHYEDGPGVGYHLFKLTNYVMNVELGANYQVEDRSDNTRTESFYYRFGEDITWKPVKLLTVTEKFEFFPRAQDPKEYRFRFESNLGYSLWQNLALNLSVIDLYDTEPALAVPKNELQFRTSLGFKF